MLGFLLQSCLRLSCSQGYASTEPTTGLRRRDFLAGGLGTGLGVGIGSPSLARAMQAASGQPRATSQAQGERFTASGLLGLGHSLRMRAAFTPVQREGKQLLVCGIGEAEMGGAAHGTGRGTLVYDARTLLPVRGQFEYHGELPMRSGVGSGSFSIDFVNRKLRSSRKTQELPVKFPPELQCVRDWGTALIMLRRLPLSDNDQYESILWDDMVISSEQVKPILGKLSLTCQRAETDHTDANGMPTRSTAILATALITDPDPSNPRRTHTCRLWLSDDEQHRYLKMEVPFLGDKITVHVRSDPGAICTIPIRTDWPGIQIRRRA